MCEYGNRRIEHVLKCDPDIDFEIEDVKERETCVYEVMWRTKHTCKLSKYRKDLYKYEDDYAKSQSNSYIVKRHNSMWSNKAIRVIFFIVIAFLLINLYLFYQNLKRDPYRNYSRAIPFRDRYRQVYRFVRTKF